MEWEAGDGFPAFHIKKKPRSQAHSLEFSLDSAQPASAQPHAAMLRWGVKQNKILLSSPL